MDKEQIWEMAKDLCHTYTCEIRKSGIPCNHRCKAHIYATRAIAKGYRKASEVAKEVIADIRQSLINMVLLNITGEEYDLAKAIADVEKKYTEGEI